MEMMKDIERVGVREKEKKKEKEKDIFSMFLL